MIEIDLYFLGYVMSDSGNKTLVLGVCGGVAAYKCAEILRQIRKSGWQVKVVMTRGAQDFITPLSFQALSGHPVHTHDGQFPDAMDHIHLAREADLVLLAPATAHLMAKLAHGLADDLLSTLCLATRSPIYIAPAMNHIMWSHPATQANVKILQQQGRFFIGPDVGLQACGEEGMGRLAEVEQIVQALLGHFASGNLSTKTIVITAGPTYEDIDPVRYIGNRSSGRMGYAMAAVAKQWGAKVILISGPTGLPTPEGVERINVRSANDMLQAVQQAVENADILISAAAVADYRASQIQTSKIKKNQDSLQLELVKNIDILSTVSRKQGKLFKVGFAAETENVTEYAKIKLEQKGLDMIIANQVGPAKGFEKDENEATCIWPGGEKHFALMSKNQLANEVFKLISERVHEEDSS